MSDIAVWILLGLIIASELMVLLSPVGPLLLIEESRARGESVPALAYSSAVFDTDDAFGADARAAEWNASRDETAMSLGMCDFWFYRIPVTRGRLHPLHRRDCARAYDNAHRCLRCPSRSRGSRSDAGRPEGTAASTACNQASIANAFLAFPNVSASRVARQRCLDEVERRRGSVTVASGSGRAAARASSS
jgi:hypothetical protein